jgi:putative transposase
MARPIRVEFEGAVYHVMARGNERQAIFRDDKDRQGFLDVLSQMVERFGVLLHVYCLMPNHYHLVVETPRANLSQAIGWLQVTYTVRFNRRHRRIGHLFQGRYKAQLVDAEGYAQSLVRYVHLNPVRPKDKRAEIPSERLEELDAFAWSSHRDYAGLRRAPRWLSQDWLGYWGEGSAARREYRAYLREAFGKTVENPWGELRGGLVLGGADLWRKAQEKIGVKTGADERHWTQGETATERRERLKDLLASEADERIKIWARVRLGGERMIEVAHSFGYKDGSAVTHMLKRVEQLMSADKPMKAKLERLKNEISSFKS